MIKLINTLKEFKFTESEAKVYISLLLNGPCTGYELSKVSGVARSKIYNILEGLTAQGILEINTSNTGSLYQAIPPSHLAAILEANFKQNLMKLEEEASNLTIREDNQTIWHLEEWQSILTKIKMKIAQANKCLLIQIWVDELDEELIQLINDKQETIKNVTVVLYDAKKEYTEAIKHYYAHGFEQNKLQEIGHRWITVVSDQTEVLYCTVPFAGVTKAIHTENPILAFFASEYILHDAYCLRLIDQFPEQIKARFGEDMQGLRNVFSGK